MSSPHISQTLLQVPGGERTQAVKSPIQDSRVAAPSRQNGVRHSERRKRILDLVSEKDKITIKDVADVITDCSEKTLQRELMSMVKGGTLIKEGERRWSTYKLAKSSV